MVCEQVSHHPPVSAFHADSQHFMLHGSIRPKLKFWAKSIEVTPKGVVTLHLFRYLLLSLNLVSGRGRGRGSGSSWRPATVKGWEVGIGWGSGPQVVPQPSGPQFLRFMRRHVAPFYAYIFWDTPILLRVKSIPDFSLGQHIGGVAEMKNRSCQYFLAEGRPG